MRKTISLLICLCLIGGWVQAESCCKKWTIGRKDGQYTAWTGYLPSVHNKFFKYEKDAKRYVESWTQGVGSKNYLEYVIFDIIWEE